MNASNKAALQHPIRAVTPLLRNTILDSTSFVLCSLSSLLLHRDLMLKRTTFGPASSAESPLPPTPFLVAARVGPSQEPKRLYLASGGRHAAQLGGVGDQTIL